MKAKRRHVPIPPIDAADASPETRRLVSLLGKPDDWEPGSCTISAEDDARGRRLVKLDTAIADDGMSEDDIRAWFLDGNDLEHIPPDAKAWMEDGAEPFELYRFTHNVGRD